MLYTSMVYNVLIVYLFFISFLDVYTKNNKKLLVILFVTPIIILSSIRWNTGIDWNPYLNLFENISSVEDIYTKGYEYGFVAFNYLVKSVYDNYSFMLFCTVIFVLFLKSKALYYLVPFPVFALFINSCYYSADLFSNRQAIAIAITMYSLIYITNRENKKFFLCLISACFFHITAFLFVFSYYIFNKSITIRKQLLWGGGAIIIMLILKSGGYSLLIGNLFPSFIANKIIMYFSMELEPTSMTIILLRTLKKILLLIVFYYMSKNIKDHVYSGLYNIFYFSVLVYIVIQGLPAPFIRMTMYFSMIEVLLLSYTLLFFKNWWRLLVLFLITIYCFIKFIYGFQTDHEVLIPYETIFQDKHKFIEYQYQY